MIAFIKKLARGEDLSLDESRVAMGLIMGGEATPAQIAAFLTALSVKGPTPDEIAGAAIVMREKATRIDVGDLPVIDTCGTGGTGKKPFNISTAAAIVAAGGGAYVAKHGNRGATSKCGSSDVLEALGVNVAAEPAVVARCIREARIGFLFAPALHGAMKYAVPVRKEIGIRTIFNVLGPLTNPAGARRQVMGVYSADLVEMIAEVMVRLGVEHALIVHSMDGLDEISLSAPTRACEVRDGVVACYDLSPAALGLPSARLEEIRAETVEEYADAVRSVLAGDKGPRRDAVLANAAAALYVAGVAESIQDGVGRAAEAIDSGAAAEALESLVTLSHESA
ncbi:MAG TPA: anthranilate phosphoribosyltransferase [Phycisphaerae bacterium]|nr:anthranilate phosphoribosyltransferase [Phycisphaerae bacterium]